jgi:hypothetical protein
MKYTCQSACKERPTLRRNRNVLGLKQDSSSVGLVPKLKQYALARSGDPIAVQDLQKVKFQGNGTCHDCCFENETSRLSGGSTQLS